MESRRYPFAPLCLIVASLLLGGCQSTAPIHVWSVPVIDSVVGMRVAVAPLAGDPQVALPLHRAMLRQQPRTPGREVFAINAAALESTEVVRLTSATEGEPSDLALLHLARQHAIDWVLQGEVLAERGRPRHAIQSPAVVTAGGHTSFDNPAPRATDPAPEAEGLAAVRVSWKLVSVTGSSPLAGQPLVTHRQPGQSTEDLIAEAAEAAWELVTPHVRQDQTQLSAPRLAWGSRDLRRGNEAAARGQWQQAEQIWSAVLHRHPAQHAAMHNLAVAAVARQDFPAAQRLIAQALRRRNSSLYQDTAVWIERRQRDYHAAFSLPDPPQGWAATRR